MAARRRLPKAGSRGSPPRTSSQGSHADGAARAEASPWMSGVDLHFHLLPGVDDGPADLAASLDLARAALAEATATVVATPHVRRDLGLTDAWEIRDRVRELCLELAAARIPLEVRCGGELGHDVIFAMSQRELELLAQGPPGARWLLVETPFEGVGDDFHAATGELRGRGFGVLVAHPERSFDAELNGAAGLRRELAAGSLAQLNALSLTGVHGEGARTAAWSCCPRDVSPWSPRTRTDLHGHPRCDSRAKRCSTVASRPPRPRR